MTSGMSINSFIFGPVDGNAYKIWLKKKTCLAVYDSLTLTLNTANNCFFLGIMAQQGNNILSQKT